MSSRDQAKRRTARDNRAAQRRRSSADDAPLLNERIRKHGKWVFVVLAVAFAASFVLGSVASSGPSLLDWLDERQNSQPAAKQEREPDAVRSALVATKARPSDAAGWIRLGDAYSAAGDTGDATKHHDLAVKAYERAAALAPKDLGLQQKLAGAYGAQANDALTAAQRYTQEAQALQSATGTNAVVTPAGPGQEDPFTKARSDAANARLQELYAKMTPYQSRATEAQTKAVAALRRVTAGRPRDASAWFDLGSTAVAANDTKTAIEAFKRFLAIVPGDPLAKDVKAELDRLQPKPAAKKPAPGSKTTTGTSTGG